MIFRGFGGGEGVEIFYPLSGSFYGTMVPYPVMNLLENSCVDIIN